MDAMITHLRRRTPLLITGFATLLATILPAPCAVAEEEVVGGVVIQLGVDAATAKASFQQAQTAMREIVAKLTELQAEYRKDGSHADFGIMLPHGLIVDATANGREMVTL